MKRLLLLALVVCLAGCVINGSGARGHWQPPYGMSREIATRETYNCQYMANMQAKWTKYSGSVADEQFSQCMQSRGFTYVYDGPLSSQNNFSSTTNSAQPSSPATYDVPGEVESIGVPQKYIFGVVDIKRLISQSAYLGKYYSLRKAKFGYAKADRDTLLEIKRIADYFCKTRNYAYIAIWGGDANNFDTGYICPPENPISPMYKNLHDVGDATFYFTSFVDRQFAEGRL